MAWRRKGTLSTSRDKKPKPLTSPATALLTTLARKINSGLETERELGIKRAAQIQQTGRWLIEAKHLVDHGNRKTTVNRKTSGTFTLIDGRGWQAWVKANLKCSPDAARLYMLVARVLGKPEWIPVLPPTLEMQVALARLAGRGSERMVPFFPDLESEKVRQKLAEPSGPEIVVAAFINGDIRPDMTMDDIRKLSAQVRPTRRQEPAAWDQTKEERAFRSALRQAARRVAESWLTRCPSGQEPRVEELLIENGADSVHAVADELRERREKRGRLTSAGLDILTRLHEQYAALPAVALYVQEARALKRVLDGKIATWHEMELLDETLQAQIPEAVTR